VKTRRNLTLDIALFMWMAVALVMIFFYAPIEKEQGIVQKIFYFHVPLAWNAFLGFFIVFVSSFRYLATRDPRWDARAVAAAEVGVLFTTLVLITGPIWAKPVWGIWWTWDARLTLTFVLWLIYLGYLMLRRYVDSPQRRGTLSAIVGIIGFIDVPLVYFAIRWWRTQHPQPVIMGGDDSGLDPRMRATLMVSAVAFMLLYIVMFKRRAAIEHLKNQLDDLRDNSQGAHS
jgi:heme exporter protein C